MNIFLSIRQIRAARGLLGWSQADLAQACGISKAAMNAIDRAQSEPRMKTLETIKTVFEDHGVEFTDGEGVRMRDNIFQVQSFEGKEAFYGYMKDVVETLKAKGGEALNIVDDEDVFLKPPLRNVIYWYYRQFEKFSLKERILMREGVMERYGPPETAEYRWVSHDLAEQVSTSVYGDKYAIALPDRFVVIENKLIAETYRAQFEKNWQKSKPMPYKESLYNLDKVKKEKY